MVRAGALLLAAACFAPGALASMGTQFREAMPRYSGSSKFEPEERAYQMDLALLGVIPLVFSILTLLAAVVTCLCKCCSLWCKCCRKCCGDPKAVDGYSDKQRLVPVVVLSVLGATCMAFAAAGLAENEKITDTLLANGEGDLSFKSFIPRAINRTQAKVDDIKAPLDDLLSILNDSVSEGVARLDSVIGVIDTGADGFVNATQAFDAEWSSDQYTDGNGDTFTCVACPTLSDLIGEIGQQLDNGVGVVVDDMRSLRVAFTDELANRLDEIDGELDDFKDQLDNQVQKALDNATSVSDDIVDQLEKYDPPRRKVTLALFVVPIAALVLALLGALFRIPLLFKINMWTYFLVCFLFWLLLAVMIPVTVALGDACEYVDDYERVTLPEKAAVPGSEGEKWRIAEACLDDSNVLEALGKRDEFNFTDQIQFVEFGNLTEKFDLPALANLSSYSASLTIATMYLYVEAVRVTARIQEFKLEHAPEADSVPTGLSAFLAADPNGFGLNATGVAAMTALQADMQVEQDTQDELDARVALMQANVTQLDAARDNSLALLLTAVEPLEDLANVTQPVIDAANRVLDEATCGEIGDTYRDAKSLICGKLLDNFATITMCLFFIAFFGWFIIVMSSLAGNRWHRSLPEAQGNDDYGGMPMKPIGGEEATAPPSSAPTAY